MKILITGAASAGAHRLKKQLMPADIILGDHAGLPELIIKGGSVIRLPSPEDAAYVHKMLILCLDNQVGLVYAINHVEYSLLINSAQLFNEYCINILTAPGEI